MPVAAVPVVLPDVPTTLAKNGMELPPAAVATPLVVAIVVADRGE